MKNLKKLLSAVLAIAMVASLCAIPISVSADEGVLHWNKNGYLYFWDCQDNPDNMNMYGTPWGDLRGTPAQDKIHGEWAFGPTTTNPRDSQHFIQKISQNLEHPDIIDTGAVDISMDVFIPSDKNTLEEGQSFYIYVDMWPRDYSTHAIPMAIGNKDGKFFAGFNRSWWATAPTSEYTGEDGTGNAIIKELEGDKWYTMHTLIDYDEQTVSYYLDNEFIGNPIMGFVDPLKLDEVWWYEGKIGDIETEESTFFIDNIKFEQLSSDLYPTISANDGKNLDIKFSSNVKSEDITEDTFTLTAGDGTAYTVESATYENGVAKLTLDKDVKLNATVNVKFNNDVRGASLLQPKIAKDAEYILIPYIDPIKYENFVDMDFEDVEIPANEEDAATFTDFYSEMPNFTEDAGTMFVNAKKYYDDNKDNLSCEDPAAYLKMTAGNFKLTDALGSGKALLFAPSYSFAEATLYGEQATHGLIIPFKDGKSITGGKVTMTFDMGKMSYGYLTSDAPKNVANISPFGVGFHDANNEISEYDVNSAWGNATNFLELGDYNGNSAVHFKPKGRSAGYAWYYKNLHTDAAASGAALWPGSPNADWGTVNKIMKYRIEADLDNGTYDVYLWYDMDQLYDTGLDKSNLNNDWGSYAASTEGYKKIGADLPIPTTKNDPSYDSFVISMGLRSVAEVYLDNLVVRAVSDDPIQPIVSEINYSVDGEASPLTPEVQTGGDVVVKFDKNIKDDKVGVELNGVALSEDDFNVKNGNVKVLTGTNGLLEENVDYTIKLTGIESTDGVALDGGFTFNFKAVGVPVPGIVNNGNSAKFTVVFDETPEKPYTVVMAAYSVDKDGVKTLQGIVFSEKSGISASVSSSDEAFTDADIIMGYVLDGLTNIKPQQKVATWTKPE